MKQGATEDTRPLIEDEAGDTGSDQWTVPGTTRDPEPMLDLRAGDITSSGNALFFAIRVTDLVEGPPPGADGASYRFMFDYWDGKTTTRLLGVDMARVGDQETIRLTTDNGAWECGGCSVSFDAARDVITGVVPLSTLEEFVKQFGAAGGNAELRNLWLQSGWVHTMRGLGLAGANADYARGEKSYPLPSSG